MCAWPKSRQMPTSAASRSSSTKCTSEPARDSSLGITSTRDAHAERRGQPLQLLDAAPRARRGCCRPAPGCCVRGRPRCTTSTLNGNPPRDVQRVLGFGDRLRARVGVGARERQRRAPAAADEALGDRRVNAVQLEPGLRQPLLQVGDRRRVVIVEVRARREQLDRVEPVRRDLQQVLAARAAAP